MDDFPKLLRAWADYLSEEAKIWPAAEKMVEAANYIENMESMIEWMENMDPKLVDEARMVLWREKE